MQLYSSFLTREIYKNGVIAYHSIHRMQSKGTKEFNWRSVLIGSTQKWIQWRQRTRYVVSFEWRRSFLVLRKLSSVKDPEILAVTAIGSHMMRWYRF